MGCRNAYGDPGLEAVALAEKSRVGVQVGDLGQALSDAARALRLAEASLDPETQAKAMEALSAAQRVQGDAFAAVETAQREVAMAGRVADRMTLYWALHSRMDAYIEVAKRCRSRPNFDGCLKSVDRAGDDLSSASTIVRGLGYTALLKSDEPSRQLVPVHFPAPAALAEAQNAPLTRCTEPEHKTPAACPT